MSVRRTVFAGRRTTAFPNGNSGSTKSAPAVSIARQATATQANNDPIDALISRGEWIAADSSWIMEVLWDVRTANAYMNTKGGGKYQYTKPMHFDFFKAWVQSDSMGSYWHSHIAGVYSPATVLSKGAKGQKGKPNVVRIANRRRP